MICLKLGLMGVDTQAIFLEMLQMEQAPEAASLKHRAVLGGWGLCVKAGGQCTVTQAFKNCGLCFLNPWPCFLKGRGGGKWELLPATSSELPLPAKRRLPVGRWQFGIYSQLQSGSKLRGEEEEGGKF